MKRRTFIAGLGSAAAWPLAARAQQPERMPRIGVLLPQAESDPEAQARVAAFRQAFQGLGWTAGRNVLADAFLGGFVVRQIRGIWVMLAINEFKAGFTLFDNSLIQFYYQSTDCTGTAYLPVNARGSSYATAPAIGYVMTFPPATAPSIYFAGTPVNVTLKSRLYTGVCLADSEPLFVGPAQNVPVSSLGLTLPLVSNDTRRHNQVSPMRRPPPSFQCHCGRREQKTKEPRRGRWWLLAGAVRRLPPPLHPGQALALWLFLPVRPSVGTDDSTAGAHHAWPERWHRHVIGPRVRA
jgi:hypothetical protein